MNNLKHYKVKNRNPCPSGRGGFNTPILEQYSYNLSNTNKNMQRKGIDFGLRFKDLKFDVKSRDYQYYLNSDGWTQDILVETVSVVEGNKPGWYYTSESDVIFYMWLNPSKTDIYAAVILVVPKVREFIEEYKKTHEIRYKSSNTYNEDTGTFYTTKFMLICTYDFPPDALIYCDVSKLSGCCLV